MKQDYTIIKTDWIASPVHKYLFNVNNRNTREIFSTLTMKTPEWRDWRCSCVLMVKFEYISHLFLVYLIMTFNMYLFPGTDIINSLHKTVFTVNNPSDLTSSSPFSLVTQDKVNPFGYFSSVVYSFW